MTQSQTQRALKRRHLRAVERLLKLSYQEGYQAGLTRAHGQGRRGRTIRDDATIQGLLSQIERHFGLERFAFEVRVVHKGSGRRLPSADPLARYRAPE